MMPHIWVRAEQRENEARVGLTPDGAASLISAGFTVTVEASETRAIPADGYANAGCAIARSGTWTVAPKDAIIFGLKELPDDGTPLIHQHIMFGHAYKGQGAGRALLDRFKSGGGTLLDLEYLVNDTGRRIAAFGYWAGFAGAAVSLMCWAAQQRNTHADPVTPYTDAEALKAELKRTLSETNATLPRALIIGALGRVGTGAADLCAAMNVAVTGWDMEQTAHGGPFPEILEHEVFFNCILAGPQTPPFVTPDAPEAHRHLTVIGDIACDPDSDYNPVQVYDRATTWAAPALRVHDTPPLDIVAIDNLPSMLPRESSADFAGQLLPSLLDLGTDQSGVWARARDTFNAHV